MSSCKRLTSRQLRFLHILVLSGLETRPSYGLIATFTNNVLLPTVLFLHESNIYDRTLLDGSAVVIKTLFAKKG